MRATTKPKLTAHWQQLRSARWLMLLRLLHRRPKRMVKMTLRRWRTMLHLSGVGWTSLSTWMMGPAMQLCPRKE